MNSGDATGSIGVGPPAHWEPLGTIVWGVVIAAVFVVLQTFTIALALVLRNPQLSESEIAQLLMSAGEDGYPLSLATIVTTAACGALVVGVIKLRKGSVLSEYLCLREVPLSATLRWFGVLAGFLIASDIISSALGRPIVPEFMSRVYATADPVWMLWVALVIAAPLFEEVFFRGFLFKGLESSFMGPLGAVVVTAGLWAAIHVQYDAYEMASVFCLGLLFGAARTYSQSLLLPLGLHAATNVVATIETAVLG